MSEAITRRCDVCHGYDVRDRAQVGGYPYFIPHTMSEDEPGLHLLDGYVKRNLVFNLTVPADSQVLLAPLSKEAGGLGICKPYQAKDGSTVGADAQLFTDTGDPDYQTILAGIERGRKYILEESNRFCMSRFVPAPSYVREMKRYGILPPDHDPNTPIDPYKTDEAYWESFWYTPQPAAGK